MGNECEHDWNVTSQETFASLSNLEEAVYCYKTQCTKPQRIEECLYCRPPVLSAPYRPTGVSND